MNLETKITIYKFTPQLFTLTRRLFRLVGSGAIRAEKKPANRQNGRWYCNAFDVLKHAALK